LVEKKKGGERKKSREKKGKKRSASFLPPENKKRGGGVESKDKQQKRGEGVACRPFMPQNSRKKKSRQREKILRSPKPAVGGKKRGGGRLGRKGTHDHSSTYSLSRQTVRRGENAAMTKKEPRPPYPLGQ